MAHVLFRPLGSPSVVAFLVSIPAGIKAPGVVRPLRYHSQIGAHETRSGGHPPDHHLAVAPALTLRCTYRVRLSIGLVVATERRSRSESGKRRTVSVSSNPSRTLSA